MKRDPFGFVLICAAFGFCIPFVFRIVDLLLGDESSVPAGVLVALDYIQLFLWPIPLLMVPLEEPGAADLSSWGPFAVATLANVALYAGLGGLTWLGLNKSRWILLVPLILVAGIWFAIWKI